MQQERHRNQQPELPAHRNRWVVEKVKFFAERRRSCATTMRAICRPMCAGRCEADPSSPQQRTLSLRGAEEIAERRIADPKDRERFLALVREAMASSVKNGSTSSHGPPARTGERPGRSRPLAPLRRVSVTKDASAKTTSKVAGWGRTAVFELPEPEIKDAVALKLQAVWGTQLQHILMVVVRNPRVDVPLIRRLL